ncbi:hypothetical protein FB639_004920 [Coemansia asiatica]|nr:hypothetical protein FB639_004920 [Coemansia asiatica]
MANRNSQAAKKLALKNKLKTDKLLTKTSKKTTATATSASSRIAKSKSSSTKPAISGTASRKQRIKELAQAKGILGGILRSSTKHTAGRKDVCESLDRVAMDSSVSEMLRGVGKMPELTEEQKISFAKKKREMRAAEYEQHQSAVTAAVDELAQLMSGSIGN